MAQGTSFRSRPPHRRRARLLPLLGLAGSLAFVSGAHAQELPVLKGGFKALHFNRSASFVCFSPTAPTDYRLIGSDWFSGDMLAVLELLPNGADLYVIDASGIGPEIKVTESSCARGTMYRVTITGTKRYFCKTAAREGAEPLLAQAAFCLSAFQWMPFLLEGGEYNFEFADRESALRAAELLRQIAERV